MRRRSEVEPTRLDPQHSARAGRRRWRSWQRDPSVFGWVPDPAMGLARLGAADARAGSGAKRCIVGELGVQCGMRAPRNTRALAAYRHDCGDWGLIQKSGMPQRGGLDLFATSAVFQVPPVNTFGAITSNGIQGHMGNL